MLRDFFTRGGQAEWISPGTRTLVFPERRWNEWARIDMYRGEVWDDRCNQQWEQWYYSAPHYSTHIEAHIRSAPLDPSPDAASCDAPAGFLPRSPYYLAATLVVFVAFLLQPCWIPAEILLWPLSFLLRCCCVPPTYCICCGPRRFAAFLLQPYPAEFLLHPLSFLLGCCWVPAATLLSSCFNPAAFLLASCCIPGAPTVVFAAVRAASCCSPA